MKGIQAFVGVGSLINTNTHTNSYHEYSRRLVEEKKNQRYTGSLVEQTKIQRRNKQLAMIPGSGFNANVDVNVDVDALSSFVPNFSSLLLGSEYEASLALQAPAQTFEPQVNTPALFAFSIIAVVFGLLQLRINGVRDAANRRQEALSFLREVKSEQLSLVSTSSSSSSSTNENENDNDTSIDKKMNVRVQKAIKNYENALKEELNLRTVIPGVRIAAPNDAAKREEDIAAAKQFLDWDIAAELDTDDDDNNNDGMNTKTSRASQSQSKNDSLDSELERQNEERNKKTSLLMQSRRRFDGQDGKDVSSSSSSSSEDQPMSNGAKAILLTVAMSQIALLILLSSDPMSTSSVFTEISGNPPDNIPLSSWSK